MVYQVSMQYHEWFGNKGGVGTTPRDREPQSSSGSLGLCPFVHYFLATGLAQRKCNNDGTWEHSDLTACIKPEIKQIASEVRNCYLVMTLNNT